MSDIDFKKLLVEAFQKIYEDQDRVRRHEDGYGDDLEEDQDRVRRHEDGYGDDLEEIDFKALGKAALDKMNRPMGKDPFEPYKQGPYGHKPGLDPKTGMRMGRDTKTGQQVPFLSANKDPMQVDAYDPVSDEDPMSLKKCAMKEVAPPSDKAEDFIRKNKKDFKKRYGARWKEVLYATAHKMFPSD